MPIKAIYESQEDVPAEYAELFSERNGQWEITGVEGIKTAGDVERLQKAAAKERAAHKTTKDLLAKFDGLDPEEVRSQLDRIPELEAAAADGKDEGKINGIVEAKVKRALAPYERENADLKTQLAQATTTIGEYAERDRVLAIQGLAAKAAAKAGIKDASIVADVQMYAERLFDVTDDGEIVSREGAKFDGDALLDGTTIETWLADPKLRDRRGHWWPATVGDGARGSGSARGPNPWDPKAPNVTKQMEYEAEHGRDKARAMAAAVGVKLKGDFAA